MREQGWGVEGGGVGVRAAISIADEGGGLRWSAWPSFLLKKWSESMKKHFTFCRKLRVGGRRVSRALEREGCEEVKRRSRGELPGSKS